MARSSVGVSIAVGNRIVLAKICERSIVYLGRRMSHPAFTRKLIELLTGVKQTARGPAWGKLSGIDWIALRQRNGGRAMVLRAPSISRTALIHLERSHENPTEFVLRLVEPDTTQRSEPMVLSESEAGSLVDTFGRTPNTR